MGRDHLHRRSLSIFMALSLVLNCIWPALVNASDRNLPNSEEKLPFEEILRGSQSQSTGQPKDTFALDRFFLLQQEVNRRTYVGRDFSIAKTANERELEEHGARINILRALVDHVRGFRRNASMPEDPCSAFAGLSAFSEEEVKKAAIEHINEGRPRDIPFFVWEVKENPDRLACLDQRLSGLLHLWQGLHEQWNDDKNVKTEIPNITEAPEKLRHQYFNWWDLSVSLAHKNGEPEDHFWLKRTADLHSIDANNSFACSEACTFKLHAKGELLHTVHLPVKTMTSFGPYLVFAMEDSFDADSGVQHLSFMDLAAYGPSLGNADIPVFRLPIVTSEPVRSLEVRNQKLIINGQSSLPVEVLMAASELQQIVINITANLVDPEEIANLLPYIESLQTVFEKIMNSMIAVASESEARTQMAVARLKELGRELEEHVQNSRAPGGSVEDLELQKRIDRIAKRLTASRSFNGRLEIFFKKLMSPKPNASLKIRRALVLVGAHRNLGQGGFLSFIADRPWLQSTLLATGILAVASPRSFVDLAEAGLAVGNGMFDYFKFSLLGMAEVVGRGALVTVSPLTDFGSSIMKQYVYDGNLSRTLIGIPAIITYLLSLFYVPHLIINLHKIFLDWRSDDWPGFVENQRRFVHAYFQNLADDEAERRKLKQEREESVQYTEEEEQEIYAFIDQRKLISPAYRSPGRIGRLWASAKEKSNGLWQAISRSKMVKQDGADHDKIKGVWSAILSVGFSYAAMDLSITQWTRTYAWTAGGRYSSVSYLTLRDIGLKYDFPIFIRPKPITSLVRLVYPDFFNTTVTRRAPQLTVPTDLNGGLRPWGMRDVIWLKETILGKPSARRAVEEELQSEWNASEIKAVTEAFEAGILDVEDAVFKHAFHAALRRLPDFVSDKDQLIALFNESPLKSAFEKRVRDLPIKLRTFVRLYSEEIYGRTMRDYLQGQLSPEEEPEGERTAGTLPLAHLKEHLIRARKSAVDRYAFRFDTSAAVAIAQRHTDDDQIFESVAKQANRGEWSPHNWLVNRKYGVIADFDPTQNRSMEQYGVVQERLKSPNAMRRAVSSEISKLLVTMPLDLTFKLVLAANIDEGSFRPIQKDLWGPNSFFYLSRDAFLLGTASGFVMSMAADGWAKLLEDARQDGMGTFGQIPKGQDAESYFRWYGKQFSAKENSLFSNWFYANSLIFWNIPSVLIMTGAMQTIFGGRMDLSLILGSYVFGLGTPLAAFFYKVDQAFERSVDFAARGVDERWLAHPAIQEMINKEKQYYRNRFQFVTDIWANVQINMLNNILVLKTEIGTRAFIRYLLYGNMVEELLVNHVFTPAKAVASHVPVIGGAISATVDACQSLFTSNNGDMWKKN